MWHTLMNEAIAENPITMVKIIIMHSSTLTFLHF